MTVRKKFMRGAIAVILIAVAGALFVRFMRSNPTLLEKSTAICRLDAPPAMLGNWFSWATPTRIFIERANRMYVHDIVSGTETTEQDYNRSLTQIQVRAQHDLWYREEETELASNYLLDMIGTLRSNPLPAISYTPRDANLREVSRLSSLIPSEATLVGLAMSDDWRRIRVLFIKPRIAPWQTLLRRFLPKYDPDIKTDLMLYTCERGGEKMHEVGRLFLPDNERKVMVVPAYDLQWTPDNQKLCFVYNSVFYTVKPE